MAPQAPCVLQQRYPPVLLAELGGALLVRETRERRPQFALTSAARRPVVSLLPCSITGLPAAKPPACKASR